MIKLWVREMDDFPHHTWPTNTRLARPQITIAHLGGMKDGNYRNKSTDVGEARTGSEAQR